MPELKNVLFLLDPKIASRAATTNKKTRNAARHRMLPPRAKYTRAATQAAKLGKVRYKSNKKSQNLNKIYNSLGYMGIANQAHRNNINNYINLYNQLRNASITQKEKDRFKLLEYAYIGGRYDPSYRISKEDLEILAKDVQKLLKLTKEICEKKIQSFR
jgi:hypothetical protein